MAGRYSSPKKRQKEPETERSHLRPQSRSKESKLERLRLWNLKTHSQWPTPSSETFPLSHPKQHHQLWVKCWDAQACGDQCSGLARAQDCGGPFWRPVQWVSQNSGLWRKLGVSWADERVLAERHVGSFSGDRNECDSDRKYLWIYQKA